jgi:hypothetical protein
VFENGKVIFKLNNTMKEASEKFMILGLHTKISVPSGQVKMRRLQHFDGETTSKPVIWRDRG